MNMSLFSKALYQHFFSSLTNTEAQVYIFEKRPAITVFSRYEDHIGD
jgi:hypothetical protein